MFSHSLGNINVPMFEFRNCLPMVEYIVDGICKVSKFVYAKANTPISLTLLGMLTDGRMQLANTQCWLCSKSKELLPMLNSPSGSSNFSITLTPRINSEANPFTPLGMINVLMDLLGWCWLYAFNSVSSMIYSLSSEGSKLSAMPLLSTRNLPDELSMCFGMNLKKENFVIIFVVLD